MAVFWHGLRRPFLPCRSLLLTCLMRMRLGFGRLLQRVATSMRRSCGSLRWSRGIWSVCLRMPQVALFRLPLQCLSSLSICHPFRSRASLLAFPGLPMAPRCSRHGLLRRWAVGVHPALDCVVDSPSFLPRPRLPGRGLLPLRLLLVAEDRELVARALAGLLVDLLALPRVRLRALGHACFSRRRLSLLMVSWRRTMRPGRRPVRRVGAGLAILRFAASASPAHTTTESSGVVVVWPLHLRIGFPPRCLVLRGRLSSLFFLAKA